MQYWFCVSYFSTQCSTTNRAAQWRQDFTISLPDFPTLLSAEGDFLSLAGSILGTHSAISNAGREKRGQTGRGRGQWQLIRRGKPGKTENKEEKEGKTHFFCSLMPQNRAKTTLSSRIWCVFYLWWVLSVTPWPAAPQIRWADAQRQPEQTSTAGSRPPASGPSAPGRRSGRSPPYCWRQTRCHLRKTVTVRF